MNAMTLEHNPVPAPTRARRTRLWLPLPLTIVWVLLAPFALILSLFTWWLPERRFGPLRGPMGAIAIGSLLLSLSGTIVEVRDEHTDIFILIF
jgi:hypothetical protein